ncbi:gustatory receptor for bitter taste 22e-like [Anopheles bellator]|uniref:gustatory receptor for bitter taste 22e-like n=1 Tax=Anopheles bellator TaxID=139047 RepID=UPI0026490A73|nr:gustatory receptor for bitter taste 22e-like [Anopheles bellator]
MLLKVSFTDAVLALLMWFGQLPSAGPAVGKRLLVKVILVDIGICLSWNGAYLWHYRSASLPYIVAWWMSTFSTLQLVIVSNILLVTLLWTDFLYGLINERVRLMIASILEVDKNTQRWNNGPADRQFILTHIAHQLSGLQVHHSALTESIRNIVRFYNFPLALILLYEFVIMISEIFYAYTSIVQGIRQGDEFFLAKYTSSFIFATFQAIQFYYIVSACADITEQAENTGVLLNEFLQTDVEPTVDRCIELFTIDLLHQDFKINNCGLYYIDYTLLFSMIATITSYLIMLVQFQLAVV